MALENYQVNPSLDKWWINYFSFVSKNNSKVYNLFTNKYIISKTHLLLLILLMSKVNYYIDCKTVYWIILINTVITEIWYLLFPLQLICNLTNANFCKIDKFCKPTDTNNCFFLNKYSSKSIKKKVMVLVKHWCCVTM